MLSPESPDIMLNKILNKGGAGISLSRQETVDRINPLLKKLIALNHAYRDVIARTPDPEIAGQLQAFLKIARTDVAKMSESIYSAGGRAYTGVDIEPGSVRTADNENELIPSLKDLEKEFVDLMEGEMKVKHQIHTRAVLSNVYTNALGRLNYLLEITGGKKRKR